MIKCRVKSLDYSPPQDMRFVSLLPFLPPCGFGFMLPCEIKTKEIKRLLLAGKANSASSLLESVGKVGEESES